MLLGWAASSASELLKETTMILSTNNNTCFCRTGQSEMASLGFFSDFSGISNELRLGKYMRDEKSVREEGENLQAVWSHDSKLIDVLVGEIRIQLPGGQKQRITISRAIVNRYSYSKKRQAH